MCGFLMDTGSGHDKEKVTEQFQKIVHRLSDAPNERVSWCGVWADWTGESSKKRITS